jgi:putative two-component system response regulator
MQTLNSRGGKQFDIMVIDDTLANVQLLTGLLHQHGYKVRPVLSGRQAIQAVQSHSPDLILLDITMPEMTGYEVCELLKKDPETKDIPIIFISALSEPFDKVKAFSLGGVDYITKPFQAEEVQARIETHLRISSLQNELEKHNHHLQELVQEQIKEITDSQMATILALAKLAEFRDEDTGRHIERVQIYCKLLAIRLSLKQQFHSIITSAFVENIFHASPLHDIGKVGIQDAILLKPAKLTPEEYDIMKKHSVIGAQTLIAVRERYPKNHFINMGIIIARSHHERWDGRGYPDGLSGQDIPHAARIMALADVYDALRSKRPYKSALSHPDSLKIIAEASGSYFDPEMVEVFMELEGEFEKISGTYL